MAKAKKGRATRRTNSTRRSPKKAAAAQRPEATVRSRSSSPSPAPAAPSKSATPVHATPVPWTHKVVLGLVVYALVLGLGELGFRALGSGYPTTLLKAIELSGQRYFTINPDYTRQFFFRSPKAPPAPVAALFKAEKPDTVYRIYVIGESTSRGFPYSKTEAFPFRLQQLLNSAQAQHRVEVVNFSIDATNSHIGLDVAQELVRVPPDLVVVYYGHNEFIGMGGSASFKSWPYRANTALSASRGYQWLRDAIASGQSRDNESLLSRMTRKPPVPFGGEVYTETMAAFRQNYAALLETFNKRNIPVVACGVVSNIRDLPPLGRDQAPSAQRLKEVQHRALTASREQLTSLVGDNATLAYQAGRALLEAERAQEAGVWLTRARDLDTLRFRASSEVNPIINDECSRRRCSYVDFAQVFEGRSPDGLVGNNWLLEHVHPTAQGHRVMAEELTKHILSHYLNLPIPEPLPQPAELATLVEKLTSAKTLLNTFRAFPYKDTGYFNPKATGQVFVNMASPTDEPTLRADVNSGEYNFISDVIKQAPTGAPTRSLLHTKLAVRLFKQNKLGRAFQELNIAVAQDPRNCHALNNRAAVFVQLHGDLRRALRMLEVAVRRCPEHENSRINQWVLLDSAGDKAEAGRVSSWLEARGLKLKRGQALKLDDPLFSAKG